jgi:uncharacterized protein YgiM (DUF1202 family)
MPERSPAPLRPNAPRPAPRHRAGRAAKSFLRAPRTRLGGALALTVPVMVAGISAVSVEDSADRALTEAASGNGATALVDMSELSERAERASRSTVRTMRPVTMKPRAVAGLWTTATLNVWTGPGEHTKRVGLIKSGTKVAVTGQRQGGYAEVLLGGPRNDRWVNARYLSETKPKPKPRPSTRPSTSGSSRSSGSSGSGVGATTATGLSSAPCPDGSSIEAGLTSNADAVYRAVCNAFPALTTYGGRDPHGEHVDGRAIDFMTSPSLGNAVAAYLRANASALNVRSIIWAQRIWTPERSGEGWRYMSDRGSATANHYDHVHVVVH